MDMYMYLYTHERAGTFGEGAPAGPWGVGVTNETDYFRIRLWSSESSGGSFTDETTIGNSIFMTFVSCIKPSYLSPKLWGSSLELGRVQRRLA